MRSIRNRQRGRSRRDIPVLWGLLGLGLLGGLLVLNPGGARTQPSSPTPGPEAPLTSEEPGSLTLTVFQNQDLALVEDRRVLSLAPGVLEYQIRGISPRLLPDSVRLEPILPASEDGEVEAQAQDRNRDPEEALQILEQRFHNPSLSLNELLKVHLGEEVEVFAPGGAGTYRGRLVSTEGGIVLEDEFGRLQVIRDAQRIQFPARPETGPVLLWTLRSELEGDRSVRLSYLTEGLDWRADYAAVLSADERSLDWEAGVTLTNRSGMDFPRVQLRLVSGQLRRVREERPVFAVAEAARAAAAPAPPGFEEQAAFEYRLYTLLRPASIPTGESVRLAFLEGRDIPVEKRYIFAAHEASGVQVWIELVNEPPLGRALPPGTVRLYRRSPQGLLLIGEDRIRHTPVGERIELQAGLAFDLVAERTVKARERVGQFVYRETVEVVLTNRKAEAVTVRVRERLRGTWNVVRASQKYEQLDAQTIEFVVELGVGATAVVQYTYEYQ